MAELFGFKFEKIKDTKSQEKFTAPANDDGTTEIAGGGFFGQVLDTDGRERSEVDLIRRYRESTASARFSAVARRYSVFLYIPFLWVLWGMLLSDVEPWGLFFLGLLILLTLLAPILFFYRGGRFSGQMARLSPAYDRPKGH